MNLFTDLKLGEPMQLPVEKIYRTLPHELYSTQSKAIGPRKGSGMPKASTRARA